MDTYGWQSVVNRESVESNALGNRMSPILERRKQKLRDFLNFLKNRQLLHAGHNLALYLEMSSVGVLCDADWSLWVHIVSNAAEHTHPSEL